MATIIGGFPINEGYQQIDNLDPNINYLGSWSSVTNSAFFQGAYYIDTAVAKTNKIQFNFVGSKLLLLGLYLDNGNLSNSVTVKIDNVIIETYNPAATNTTTPRVQYIKTGLDFKEHSVEIYSNVALKFTLDSIGIDDTGTLKQFNNFPAYLSGSVKTNLADIRLIGDTIACRYTALTSGIVGAFSELGSTVTPLIPATLTSTTVDGKFYWIYVGKDYLGRKKFIADRNIQGSISWDTLNTTGIEGDGINPSTFNVIPNMTSNTAPSGIVSASVSNQYGYDPYQAFKINGYGWYGNGSSGWLKYQFTNQKRISFYSISHSSSQFVLSTMPKNWTFEGSNDGTNWTILDTQNNITWVNDEKKKFKINIPDYYLYYRINVSAVNGAGYISISKLEMMEDFTDSSKYKSSIRLLTGGVTATDIDNEWDQIIVNSTLNNTIIAGDNNIWNWSGAYSWTDTVTPNSAQRALRGNSLVNTWTVGTTTSVAITNAFRPVLVVEQLINTPKFTGNLLSNSIHTENAILTGSISNSNNASQKVQYKILVNDTQIYPTSGYTDLTLAPLSINYSIDNNLLTQIQNKITIIINSEANIPVNYNFYATLYNNAPIGILSLSNTTTHNTNIELTGNITDTDLDKISYRILINNNEVLTWSTFINDPYIDYTINANDLNIGNNTITIEYKDNYKNVGLGNWINNITRTNSSPNAYIEHINGTITGTMFDPENDPVQYRILINGIQKYPVNSDYTELSNDCNINYQINRNDILMGKNNVVTIFVKDSLGTSIGQEISFMGDYIGLMFMDENQKFYTTDIGELLQYLDFGTITLGQITEPVKILVQNKYGFSINNINLFASNTLPNVSIELSKEENPFIPTKNLILDNTYKPNEIDYFYIRLNTSISADSVSGEFKIYAKATPINID
jgi:hypothetical protein